MKERSLIWLEKLTKKELALIARAEGRAEVRKVDLERDINYPRGRAPGFVTVHRYWRPDTASRL